MVKIKKSEADIRAAKHQQQKEADEYRDLLHHYTMRAMEGILASGAPNMSPLEIAKHARTCALVAISAVEVTVKDKPEPAEFKVGDRVKVVGAGAFIGRRGKVTSVEKDWVMVAINDDFSKGRCFRPGNLEHLPTAPTQDVNAQLLEAAERIVYLWFSDGDAGEIVKAEDALRAAIEAANKTKGGDSPMT